MNKRNTILAYAILALGLCSCSKDDPIARLESDALNCCISTSQTNFSAGDIVKIDYTIGNTGSDDTVLVLHYLDDRLVFAPAMSTPAVAPSLEITSDHFGVIEYDNFGIHSYLPSARIESITAGGALSGVIAFDTSATFVVRQNDKVELLGGIDHDGLRVPEKYRIRMVLRIGENRELRSNEIEIEIEEK